MNALVLGSSIPTNWLLSSPYQRLPFESTSMSWGTVSWRGCSHCVTMTRVPLPVGRGSVALSSNGHVVRPPPRFAVARYAAYSVIGTSVYAQFGPSRSLCVVGVGVGFPYESPYRFQVSPLPRPSLLDAVPS